MGSGARQAARTSVHDPCNGAREVWLTSCDHRIMGLSNSIVARNVRVLVAEDDDDFRSLVVSSLREDGYDVIEARTGDELLELITPPVIFDPPDAIVTDVRMPGVDGL